MWLLSFILLIGHIELVDFQILNKYPLIMVHNFFYIWSVNILLTSFVLTFMGDIFGLFLSAI